MSSWQDISTAPKDGTRILLRYWKGGKGSRARHSGLFIVTEGYFLSASVPTWSCEWWVDGLGRLLEDTMARTGKNKVTHWQPLPEEPL